MQTKELALLDVWGHSWEMGTDPQKWEEAEKFFKMIAHNPSIHYTSQIDLVDYINAFKHLKFSVDKNIVYNPSSTIVFFKFNGKIYDIPSGKTIVLSNE